jgi:ABC-type lipoprotein release transport system permease subunit
MAIAWPSGTTAPLFASADPRPHAALMLIQIQVAFTHLTGRRRQTLVSLTGVVLGVAFFLAVSSLMRGSEQDFIKRLVDNSPHITVWDDVRWPRTQPAERHWASGTVKIRNVKPQTETRGIRGYREKLAPVEAIPGLWVAPVLVGSAVLTFAGREEGVTLSGIVRKAMKTNLVENGKKVEVRINDRGPYADDRVIDLSSRAAKKLGMKEGGTAEVKIITKLAHPNLTGSHQ